MSPFVFRTIATRLGLSFLFLSAIFFSVDLFTIRSLQVANDSVQTIQLDSDRVNRRRDQQTAVTALAMDLFGLPDSSNSAASLPATVPQGLRAHALSALTSGTVSRTSPEYSNYTPYVILYHNSVTEATRHLAALDPLFVSSVDPTYSSLLTDFGTLTHSLDMMFVDVEAGRQNDNPVAKETLFTHAGATWQDSQTQLTHIEQATQAMVQAAGHNATEAQTTLEDDRAHTQQSIFVALTISWALLAVFIVLAFLFGSGAVRSILRPMRIMLQRFTGLAEGDLRPTLVVQSKDEFGRLASTFNSSMVKVSRLVSRIQREATLIGQASDQIATTSQEQAADSFKQAETINVLMKTIEALAETANRIATTAEAVSSEADSALISTTTGQTAIAESIRAMKDIMLEVEIITQRILALSAQVQQAGKIVTLIETLAGETHMLALNAAIESANAGEDGKRFGIVASQVKSLAQRSRNAAKDVQQILGQIRTATHSSVIATESGLKRAEEGVALALHSGEATTTIVEIVHNTAELARAISDATQQQRASSQTVVETMYDLTKIIRENAYQAQQTALSMSVLDASVAQLQQAAADFTVDNDTLELPEAPTPLQFEPSSAATLTLTIAEQPSNVYTPAQLRYTPTLDSVTDYAGRQRVRNT